MNIRECLMEEMDKCNSLKLFKNRVKKYNEILPDCVLNNVLSYVSCDCKKCVRTRRVLDNVMIRIKLMRKDWEGVDIEEIYCTERYTEYQEDCLKVWFYYFQELNHFPMKPTFYKRWKGFDESDFINCKNWYEALYMKNLKIHRGGIFEHSQKFRECMIWIIFQRGCQFYPPIFNEEFRREFMYCVFGL